MSDGQFVHDAGLHVHRMSLLRMQLRSSRDRTRGDARNPAEATPDSADMQGCRIGRRALPRLPAPSCQLLPSLRSTSTAPSASTLRGTYSVMSAAVTDAWLVCVHQHPHMQARDSMRMYCVESQS